MKESKKGQCEKCEKYFYVHEHHILPKSIFEKKGNTAKLCPNCHTHFHEYSKTHTKEPNNEQEALKIWTTWLKVVPVIVSMILIGGFLLDKLNLFF
jgi:hypothetical protein